MFSKKLNEALIVKVRGVLGGDDGDPKENHTVEPYHAMRTYHEWLAFLGVESRSKACGNHHGNARSETCGS